MARFKEVDRSPRFLPIVLEAQLQPGSFEYALDYLVDKELDLARLRARYRNDDTGAPAYDPSVMLKIVLLAYSRGMISSRAIERACRENVLFIALSGDSAPQFTTIARFVRELGDDIASLFQQVLMTCDAQGLIGRQMFAIDGVKLSSNASKHRSGNHEDLARKAARMECAVHKMIEAHRQRDKQGEPSTPDDAAQKRSTDRLLAESKRIRDFLSSNKERANAKGGVCKSNVTDNESAKMATSKGVLQGYTAVAAVDSETQVIVAATAHGSGSEQSVLLPMVRLTDALRTEQTVITADAGYHSEANLRALHDAGIPALIADGQMRRRDERFKDQARYKKLANPLYDKSKPAKNKLGLFQPADFEFDEASRTCICPAGRRLHSNGGNCTINGRSGHKFSGTKRDCEPCALRNQCLRHPERTPVRQVVFFQKGQHVAAMRFTERMRKAIDSERGRKLYGRRMATVEPVFGNLRANKRLDRFTLRGQRKVDTQWKLYCLVHNIEKLAHNGYGG